MSMSLIYLQFFLYETKKLWRYPDNAMFWENGVIEMSTTKQPIVYIRGSQHALAMLKLLALEVNGIVVREGNSAINYRFYVSTEKALVAVAERLKIFTQLPFIYMTKVHLPFWQWRYHTFLSFIHQNNIVGSDVPCFVTKLVHTISAWPLTLFQVVSTFATIRMIFFLCLIRRV